MEKICEYKKDDVNIVVEYDDVTLGLTQLVITNPSSRQAKVQFKHPTKNDWTHDSNVAGNVTVGENYIVEDIDGVKHLESGLHVTFELS